MDRESEEDGGFDADMDSESETDVWSADDATSDTTSDPAADPFAANGWSTSGYSADAYHRGVVQPMGWMRPRRRQRMPRTPLGWAAWGAGVVVASVVAWAIYTANGPVEAEVPDSGPADPALVRAVAATACGVNASAVSAPDDWSHGDVDDPMGEGRMVFYDVPVSGGSVTATVMLADHGNGWQESGRSCER